MISLFYEHSGVVGLWGFKKYIFKYPGLGLLPS